MPRRDDLKTILLIGSGPIVIGQGCEFDYSGTQACKALREEGYKVVLVNSNPATIMTDPQFADRTYIEPITPEAVTKIIEKHRGTELHIDALLPTLGGQTALNCACALFDDGTLTRLEVEMIGANREVIHRAEDREKFKQIVESIGLRCPEAHTAETLERAREILDVVGLPAIIRPAFTLGGTGGGIAYNRDEFDDIARRGLDASMNSQILIDRSLLGWKEYEMEVMRDHDDNAVIICCIENFDPMGVHTGDSITVAPAQTLSDKEYQRMRDASLAILRAVGVETGGSNVQFGVNPADGEMVVIEMNPRVSRSSALASKATGFPIAKIAAKLAVGYALWELPNDITGETVACFEPSIDYVVTKIPRWTFEKFPEADETLTTQMKSVGEGMSIGRTFKESLQKGIRSMEVKRFGLGLDAQDHWLAAEQGRGTTLAGAQRWPIDEGKLRRKLEVPSQGRMYYLRYAFKSGWSVDDVFQATKIDPWYLGQLKELVDFEDRLIAVDSLATLPRELLLEAKRLGYSDAQLAQLYLGDVEPKSVLEVRSRRKAEGVTPVYKLVDTCAAEFAAKTPYYYAAYEAPFTKVDGAGESGAVDADEVELTGKTKIVILGGGPNRIGQGIEFDYCCVQAAFAAQELGFEAVLVNSNPETVSTDYDTSDLLFFEPLTLEDVLNVCERVNGKPLGEAGGLLGGVVVQFGGQTPLNLAAGLEAAGVPIIGTGVDAIDLAEDRDRFAALCDELGVRQPDNGIARGIDEAVAIAERIGYPVLVRPSFVLGGRAMETVFDEEQLRRYMVDALGASDLAGQPILVDRFLFNATECDVDVVADFGTQSAGSPDPDAHPPRAVVAAVMEHIEEAGIHSGDSACTIPPHSLKPATVEEIKRLSRRMAERLRVRGLMNCQWAVQKDAASGEDQVYVIEVNPRASRTVPFVGKATGVGWANLAAKVMMGKQLGELGVVEEVDPAHHAVKESVFPFGKFPGVDVILGPEMRSTGECMGIDADFAVAFAKSQMAAGTFLPTGGLAFLSVRREDREAAAPVARKLIEQGFSLCGTGGTAAFLAGEGVEVRRIPKIIEGGRPNAIDLIKNRELALLINTPTRKGAGTDEGKLRATAVRYGVPMITTMTAATLAVDAITRLRADAWGVKSLQAYAADARASR
ncbi:carbamoyl-phosphate synthase large subunit [Phycisphaera mikurensis]|uniref:Carbamoyl phosphate synthase large chain n=1 Tax=Phycisphaera mikurensis (strain NBRC 102666 / KCTC 22515 / FYK2301M01) TaxID=1142394 RepID=I0IDD0_PHYMF|nr:carbamoyl-phosphate synthase large subunit [Phycisphaera mikurensis]MBB6443345.1 carbamoyl-phosphate synthase large subunit [Phycisphaera mikurensis]BAM03268.1 carbamoyl-phosphate synthase large chain [Phycisphaera mikurensis NBRC 102666]